jgi:hypothetical protein
MISRTKGFRSGAAFHPKQPPLSHGRLGDEVGVSRGRSGWVGRSRSALGSLTCRSYRPTRWTWAPERQTDRILPNGYCLLPPRQSCDRGNACLTCDKFATDRTHLDEHQRQLSGLLQIVDARREQFQRKTGREMREDNVWLRERRKERRALQSIIAALNATAQSDQAVRGAGVQARLEEGRA